MTSIHIQGFEDDVEIEGIGQYFRQIKGKSWRIALKLKPNKGKDHTNASNAPALARGRVINQVHNKGKTGYGINFRITDTASWTVGTVGDCPLPRTERYRNSQQLCFVFTTEDGKTIYLPQFELARVLFFHGVYLSRTALESECLRSEFTKEIDQENNAFIKVMESSGFYLNHLNEPKSRMYLSWILLNDEVLRSYESITRYQRLNGVDTQSYRRWTFQFDPPPLRDVYVHVRAQYSEELHTGFVYEIKEIENLPTKHFNSVKMWHPKFAQSVPRGGQATVPAGIDLSDHMTVFDDLESNTAMQPVILAADTVSIRFTNPFYVEKVATAEKHVAVPDTREKGDGKLSSVSTEEGVADHGLPSGDWDTLEDKTDYNELLANKFECFLKMVDILVNHHACILLDQDITMLRRVGKSRKHLLSTDGKNRGFADITLVANGKVVHLLEVDTSDAEQSMSTQILVAKNTNNWKRDAQHLKDDLVRSSLRWPKKILKQVSAGGRFRGIPHPQTPGINKGVLPPDSIAGWAARMHGRMLQL